MGARQHVAYGRCPDITSPARSAGVCRWSGADAAAPDAAALPRTGGEATRPTPCHPALGAWVLSYLWGLACTRRAARSGTITLSTLWPLRQFLGGCPPLVPLLHRTG